MSLRCLTSAVVLFLASTVAADASADTEKRAEQDYGQPNDGVSVGDVVAWPTGRGVARDETRGVALLQRACDGSDTGSCFVLGCDTEMALACLRIPLERQRSSRRHVAPASNSRVQRGIR